jgi:hypothetical protein
MRACRRTTFRFDGFRGGIEQAPGALRLGELCVARFPPFLDESIDFECTERASVPQADSDVMHFNAGETPASAERGDSNRDCPRPVRYWAGFCGEIIRFQSWLASAPVPHLEAGLRDTARI